MFQEPKGCGQSGLILTLYLIRDSGEIRALGSGFRVQLTRIDSATTPNANYGNYRAYCGEATHVKLICRRCDIASGQQANSSIVR
jgi:hypothetical protein